MDTNKRIMRRILAESRRGIQRIASKANGRRHAAKSEVPGAIWKSQPGVMNVSSPEMTFSEMDEQLEVVENQNMAGTTKEYQNQADQIISQIPSSASSYMLASDRSTFSGRVDNWFRNSLVPTQSAAIQSTSEPQTRSASTSLNATSMWYLLAMLMPLCSVNNYLHWTCNRTNVMNIAELILTQLARLYDQIRDQMRRMAEDHLARDLFATLMDIVLVFYAIGFLFLSLYQAAVFA